jgi:hypothetical protein
MKQREGEVDGAESGCRMRKERAQRRWPREYTLKGFEDLRQEESACDDDE